MNTSASALQLTRVAKEKLRKIALTLPNIMEKQDVMEIHGDVLDSLLLLAEIEKVLESAPLARKETSRLDEDKDTSAVNYDETVSDEVAKVKRKLPRWAKNPHQINHKILKLYLELQSEQPEITESLLMEHYGDHAEFLRNYNQMKMISTNNHAKVFEVNNGLVTIWEPVVDLVSNFKDAVAHRK